MKVWVVVDISLGHSMLSSWCLILYGQVGVICFSLALGWTVDFEEVGNVVV